MKKVLIIDDEEDILLLTRTHLTFKGYDVRVSTSCREGLQLFYAFQPDLLFIDVNVGKDDGRELCSTIRQQAAFLHVPIILISGNELNLKNHRQHGANGTLSKPFSLTQLVKTVEDYLVDS